MAKIKHNRNPKHPDFPHSMNGYRYGCRCEICFKAAQEYYIATRLKKNPDYKPTHRYTAKRIAHGRDVNHPQFPHGTMAGYAAGCKCVKCKRANADKDLRYRKERNPDYVPRFKKTMYLPPNHAEFPHGTNDGFARGDCRCIECVRAHKAYQRAYSKKFQKTPVEKQKQKIRQLNYRKTERGRTRHVQDSMKRYALKRNCEVDFRAETIELMRLIYLNCPKGYQVDHIIPLSKRGQHHPDNLQYLPALINMKKNNNLDYDCSEYAIAWQTILDTSSTTIPSGSTPKRVEALHTLQAVG